MSSFSYFGSQQDSSFERSEEKRRRDYLWPGNVVRIYTYIHICMKSSTIKNEIEKKKNQQYTTLIRTWTTCSQFTKKEVVWKIFTIYDNKNYEWIRICGCFSYSLARRNNHCFHFFFFFFFRFHSFGIVFSANAHKTKLKKKKNYNNKAALNGF